MKVREVNFLNIGPIWCTSGRVWLPSDFKNYFEPRNKKFRRISGNFRNFENGVKNFIFKGSYNFEYLSNLHEKLTVRKIKFWSFWHLFVKLKIFQFLWFEQLFRAKKFYQISGIFQKFEIGVKKTLFSEACIFSNICRIYMKSWLWERSNSEVYDVFLVKTKRSQLLSFERFCRATIFFKIQEIFKNLKLAPKKLYFQRLVYFRIFVGLTWKVDREKGQILKFSSSFKAFSWDLLRRTCERII